MVGRGSKGVHFSPLDYIEKRERFNSLAAGKQELFFWLKGEGKQFRAKALTYFEKGQVLFFEYEESLAEYLSQTMLVHFVDRGRIFFSSGPIEATENANVYQISFADLGFFSCERRSQTRVSGRTLSSFQIIIPFEGDSHSADINKIIDSQKNDSLSLPGPHKVNLEVFRNFLNLPENQEYQKSKFFFGKDLSSSGASLMVNAVEADFFQVGREIRNFVIMFNEVVYRIKGAKIVNKRPFKDKKRPKTKLFKIGLQFLDLSSDVVFILRKQLEEEIRDFDSKKVFEELV